MAGQRTIISLRDRDSQRYWFRNGLVLEENMLEHVMGYVALGHDIELLCRPGHVARSNLVQKPGQWADEERFQPRGRLRFGCPVILAAQRQQIEAGERQGLGQIVRFWQGREAVVRHRPITGRQARQVQDQILRILDTRYRPRDQGKPGRGLLPCPRQIAPWDQEGHRARDRLELLIEQRETLRQTLGPAGQVQPGGGTDRDDFAVQKHRIGAWARRIQAIGEICHDQMSAGPPRSFLRRPETDAFKVALWIGT